MKLRLNPTNKQLLRRIRRPPESINDPRLVNDAYVAVRQQGYSHSYAKRVYRDQLPQVIERAPLGTNKEIADQFGLEPDDLFFEDGETRLELEVEIRPPLTNETILALVPRSIEYTVWDEEVHMLGVRVRTTGYKCFIFYYRIRYETKLHKVTIGSTKQFDLTTAREMAKELRYEARMGRNPFQRPKI